MNFSPHHAFGNCQRLEVAVNRTRTSIAPPIAIIAGHDKYHFAMIHKLRAAMYHVDALDSYLGQQGTAELPPAEVVYRTNYHLDGFLYNVGSAMDIFAREMLTYFNIALPAKVYYQTARAQITAARAGDTILPFLDDPAWKPELSNYRNTSTHESLVSTGYSIKIEIRGAHTVKRLVFPLPDDPRAAAPTFIRNQDIVAYCKATLKRAISHFNQAYGHLTPRIVAGGLPL